MGTTDMETTTDATRATAKAMSAPTILSLYQTWSAEYDRINRKGAGFTPEQVAALCEPHAAVMDQICSLDSRSPLDVLAKLIAASYKLESCVDSGWVDSIRDEALAMLAESGPSDLFVATGVGHTLSEMLDASESALTAISEYDDLAPLTDPTIKALCERRCQLALAICGYRPLSKAEQRAKAEFLRDWTESTPLSEEEQNALIASMLPEGGAA
jgi:hypothetical protein